MREAEHVARHEGESLGAHASSVLLTALKKKQAGSLRSQGFSKESPMFVCTPQRMKKKHRLTD
jgi:hypothetical protein